MTSLPTEPRPAALGVVLDDLRSRIPLRTWSLIVSFFGDAIAPRGGAVWSGSLIAFMALLGIDGNAVRVALHRLAREDWLESRRRGRRAYYRLTASGTAIFAAATHRIYDPPSTADEASVELAILTDPEARAGPRQRLQAAGWGTLASNILIRPLPDRRQARPPADGLISLTARPDPAMLRQLAALSWPLDELDTRFRDFEATFRPALAALEADPAVTPEQAITLRVLLVHEYRRIVLKAPDLPSPFLSEDWPGRSARALAAAIYHRILPAAEAWLDAEATTEAGPLPPADPRIHDRFR